MKLARALFLALAVVALPASAQDDVSEVAARVHREGGYGARLPVADGEGRRLVFGGAGGRQTTRERSSRERRPERSRGSIAVPPGTGLVGYALLAVAIVVVLGLLAGVLARARAKAGTLAPALVRPSRPPTSPARDLAALAGDPEALAREGRYSEAIAAAMLEGLRIVGWRPEGHGRSRTAREVLASVDSADARRAPLSALVSIEERIAFGGDDATRERWDEARARWIELGGTRP